MPSLWILIGSVFGFLSVAMGAFGAHALSESLSPKSLQIYQTAAQYQMYHALALICFGLYSMFHPLFSSSFLWLCTGSAFTLGIFFFSGSLYALALTDIKILGAITPIGGLFFLLGWVLFGVCAFYGKSPL